MIKDRKRKLWLQILIFIIYKGKENIKYVGNLRSFKKRFF